ncbi:MAG: acyl carrier protein [Fimbriimonadaceae bacterium]|nr:acyl carrier protein [Fimbriimonadaceae bacterium]
MEVAQDVLQIIANYKGITLADVRPEQSFEELGIDSLDAIDIIYEIEDKYGIDIPQDALDLQNTKTVADVMTVVQTHLDNGAPPPAATTE